MAIELVTVWNGATWRDDRPVVAAAEAQSMIPEKPPESVTAYILRRLADEKPRTLLDLKRGTGWTANAFYLPLQRLLATGQIQAVGYQHGAGGRLWTVARRV